MNIHEIKPIHLLSQELNYELRIRGIVTERKEASQKRKMLARLLKRDRDRKDISLADSDYIFENERRVIEKTTESIKKSFLNLKLQSPTLLIKELDRLYNKYAFTNRVCRIKLTNDDTRQKILNI